MKNPTEELTGHILFTLVVGYFAALNMTDFFCLCERSEAISREGGGLRSIFSVLFQGDCRGTSCLAMTTSRAMVRWDISLSLNMTYFLSPIGALRHFAYAADAPLLSLSRHFPRFSGGIYPEGGSKKRHYLIKNAPTAILQSARKFLFKIT